MMMRLMNLPQRAPEPLLQATALEGELIAPIDFTVGAGEIVGLIANTFAHGFGGIRYGNVTQKHT